MKSIHRNISDTTTGKISMVFIGLYSLLLLIMPYFRGLFFDIDFYKFELLLGILFLFIIFYFNKKGQSDKFQSYIIYPILGFVLVYFISAFSSPVGFMAFQEAFRWLIYVLVFIGLLFLLNHKWNDFMLHVLFISIAWTATYGLLAHFELVHFREAIIWDRIASVFQYPNTFAAIVAAGILGILIYSIHSNQKWYFRLSYSAFLVPFVVVIIFTQSRATLVMLPIVWLVALVFLTLKKQIQYVISTILLVITATPLLLIYDRYVDAKDPTIIIWLFAAGFVYSGSFLGLHYLFDRVQSKPKSPYLRAIIPGIMIIFAIVGIVFISSPSLISLLPDALSQRLGDINLDTRSVTERGTFYKDSIEMFKDYPILGAGGNGWKGLYYSYQSLPYTSTQTHSFFMKLLVEVGLLGTLLFLVFLSLFMYTVYRWFRKYGFQHDRIINISVYLIMALMLLMHSMVDFDMSYGYFALLWFTLMAMIYVEIREPDTEPRFKKMMIGKPMMWGTLGISAIVLIFISLNTYATAINVGGIHYSEALDKINTKVALSPSNIDYRMQKLEVLDLIVLNSADTSFKEELLREAIKISEIDKNNPVTLLQIGQYFAKYGYGKNALDVSKQAIEKAPWFMVAYEQYVSFGSQLSTAFIRNGDVEGAKMTLEQVVTWLNSIEDKVAHLKTMPESLQYHSFTLTDPILRNGGSALVLVKEYDRARSYLEPLLNSNDPTKKIDAILWLSILEEKTGNVARVSQLVEEGRKSDPDLDQKRLELLSLVDLVP